MHNNTEWDEYLCIFCHLQMGFLNVWLYRWGKWGEYRRCQIIKNKYLRQPRNPWRARVKVYPSNAKFVFLLKYCIDEPLLKSSTSKTFLHLSLRGVTFIFSWCLRGGIVSFCQGIVIWLCLLAIFDCSRCPLRHSNTELRCDTRHFYFSIINNIPNEHVGGWILFHIQHILSTVTYSQWVESFLRKWQRNYSFTREYMEWNLSSSSCWCLRKAFTALSLFFSCVFVGFLSAIQGIYL